MACASLNTFATKYGEVWGMISPGYQNTILQGNSSRKFYILGGNDNNQAGLGMSASPMNIRQPIEFQIYDKRVTAVAHGAANNYILLLTDGCTYPVYGKAAATTTLTCTNTSMWGTGTDGSGQLGIGSSTTGRPMFVQSDPTNLFTGDLVISIIVANSFSVALKSNGVLYAWGSNTVGQLGDGTTVSRLNPVPVEAGPTSALYGKTIADVRCGGSSCLVLTTDNNLIMWGQNLYGTGAEGSSTTVLRTLPVFVGKSHIGNKTIIGIEAGAVHMVVLTDKAIYTWGQNTPNNMLGDESGGML